MRQRRQEASLVSVAPGRLVAGREFYSEKAMDDNPINFLKWAYGPESPMTLAGKVLLTPVLLGVALAILILFVLTKRTRR